MAKEPRARVCTQSRGVANQVAVLDLFYWTLSAAAGCVRKRIYAMAQRIFLGRQVNYGSECGKIAVGGVSKSCAVLCVCVCVDAPVGRGCITAEMLIAQLECIISIFN